MRITVDHFKTEQCYFRASNLKSALINIVEDMFDYCNNVNKRFMITETVTFGEEDKALNRVSTSHQEGRAVDISVYDWGETFRNEFISHFTQKYGHLGAISKQSGEQCLIVFHDNGHGPHCHIQIKPGV